MSYDQRLSLEIKGVIHLSLRSDQSLCGGPGLPTPHLTPTSCSRTAPKFDARLHQSAFCSLVIAATPFILGVGLLSLCLEELQEELGWIRSNPFGFFPWENSSGHVTRVSYINRPTPSAWHVALSLCIFNVPVFHGLKWPIRSDGDLRGKSSHPGPLSRVAFHRSFSAICL